MPSGWRRPKIALAATMPTSRWRTPRKSTSSETAEQSARTSTSRTPRLGPRSVSSESQARRSPRRRSMRCAQGAVTRGRLAARPSPHAAPTASAASHGGPAAAWGSAFGNLIGDFFGGLGPGDFFGFWANFLYGLVPYLVWEAVTDAEPVPRTVGWRFWRWRREDFVTLVGLVFVITLAATLCATVVGWGLQALGFHPFYILGRLVLLNNLVVALVLAPPLLTVLYPRIRHARLLYRDLLGPRPALPRWRMALGVALAVAGTTAAYAAGDLIASGRWLAPWAPYHTATGAF